MLVNCVVDGCNGWVRGCGRAENVGMLLRVSIGLPPPRSCELRMPKSVSKRTVCASPVNNKNWWFPLLVLLLSVTKRQLFCRVACSGYAKKSNVEHNDGRIFGVGCRSSKRDWLLDDKKFYYGQRW